MHQYIETVRNEIEAAAGQETYLASTLFLRMYKDFKYEDDGVLKLSNKEAYENVQNKAINSLGKTRGYDEKEEILAWQVAILRDISKDFYNWWIDYKDEKFRADDHFSDGESCIALEASCEKLDQNPTDIYSALLEVEFILTRLCTSCNKTVLEIDNYWQFKFNNKKKAPLNKFMLKRIEAEGRQTIIFKSIQQLQEVSTKCREFGDRLAGSDHLLWMIPHHMLQSLIHSLKGFLFFEYVPDADLSLTNWLADLFPERLPDNQPNPTFQSALHRAVIANLSQATQCMVQQTVRKNNVFEQRDNIMRPYFYDALEKVKLLELHNLGSIQQDEYIENRNT